MRYNLKKNKSYELKLTVTLDKADLDYYVSEAQKYLANDLKIEGSRLGKVPPEIAKDKLDKKQILETAFDLAFKQSFADILLKEKFELIDARGFEVDENSEKKLAYSILLTVFPEFKAADYRRISVDKNDTSVSGEEVSKALELIRNSKKKDGVVPELTDDFARKLGRFENLEGLKDSIGQGLKKEKEMKESQRIKAFVLGKVAGKTKIEVPPVLVIRQLDQMMLDLDADLHREGMELGLFLAKIKKTSEELRKGWQSKAELLVKKALILKEIARIENIKVEPEEVKEKINGLLQNFSSLEEAQKNVDLTKLSSQIEQILLNEKVLALLEKEAKYN